MTIIVGGLVITGLLMLIMRKLGLDLTCILFLAVPIGWAGVTAALYVVHVILPKYGDQAATLVFVLIAAVLALLGVIALVVIKRHPWNRPGPDGDRAQAERWMSPEVREYYRRLEGK